MSAVWEAFYSVCVCVVAFPSKEKKKSAIKTIMKV